MAEHDVFRAPWRAGFEVEVVLGDLGNDRYSEDGPMDEASQSYKQEVAAVLKEMTGRPWTAPRKAPSKTGYYVLGEYDIDPITFTSRSQIAGVELVTPPLPLVEAEDLRQEMKLAIYDMDGAENADPSSMTDCMGWHINVDPFDGNDKYDLDPVSYCVFVDEIPMLLQSGRIGTKYAGLQRHAYGPALLRDISLNSSLVQPDVNMVNFMTRLCGASKYFAANFSRASYVELRHYGVVEFMSGDSLQDLVGPALHGFEVQRDSQTEGMAHHLSVFRTLCDWFQAHRHRFSYVMEGGNGMTNVQFGQVLFDGSGVGRISWNGAAQITLWDGRPHENAILGIWNQNLSDVMECVALLCLDAADFSIAGYEIPLAPGPLKEAVMELRDEIMKLPPRPAPDPVGWWEREHG